MTQNLVLPAEAIINAYAPNAALKKQQKYDFWWLKICEEPKELSRLTTAQALDVQKRCEADLICWTPKQP